MLSSRLAPLVDTHYHWVNPSPHRIGAILHCPDFNDHEAHYWDSDVLGDLFCDGKALNAADINKREHK